MCGDASLDALLELFKQSYSLLWVYGFVWTIVIVRKIFYA